MDTGQWIVIGLSLVMLLWFAGAYLVNRRRGSAAARWIRNGMAQLGALDSSRLPGSKSAGRLALKNPTADFRTLEVFYTLEVRENLPLWLLQHWQGRRDQLVIQARLIKPPGFDLDAARGGDTVLRTMVDQQQKQPFILEAGPDGFEIARRGRPSEEISACLQEFLTNYRDSLIRCTLRRSEPHLLIRLAMEPAMSQNSEQFFASLGRLASMLR